MDRDAVFTLEQALERMRGLIGFAGTWTDISTYLPDWGSPPTPAPALGHCLNFCGLAGTGQRRQGGDPPSRDFCADPAQAEGLRSCQKAFRKKKKACSSASADGRTGTHGAKRSFATAEPVTVRELEARMPHGSDPGEALVYLRKRYEGRGVHVVKVGDAWAIRTAPIWAS